ncbi:ferredoxin [Streptomyces alboflavus]|uniref:ferredoxin n=1 Tax=Streptomyces alboflavus TaxID=67267 RepID=UPI00069103CA|nr:ferredoxin [Streptomyces alboflavus]
MSVEHHQSPELLGDAAAPARTGSDELVIRVDKLHCAGSGVCVSVAQQDLAFGPDGRAMALHATTTASEELFEAVEMCPTEAIRVHRAATGELVAPLE